jgi:NADH dehydrogenase [ubiquinone] 1 alpha subcomplex assembly factor 6
MDHIGSHIGKALGIISILRGIPILVSSNTSHPQREGAGAVVLPLDICAAYGLRQEDVLRQRSQAPGLKDTVFKVATAANDHIIIARKMFLEAGDDAKGHAFPTFLSAVIILFDFIFDLFHFLLLLLPLNYN